MAGEVLAKLTVMVMTYTAMVIMSSSRHLIRMGGEEVEEGSNLLAGVGFVLLSNRCLPRSARTRIAKFFEPFDGDSKSETFGS